MSSMAVTLPVFQLLMSWSNDVANQNMAAMLVTWLVSQPPIGWLNACGTGVQLPQAANMAVMSVTLLVFQVPMCWSNAGAR